MSSPDEDDRSSLFEDERAGAILGDKREYRYRLWRTWDIEKPTVAFIMLNPSTADEDEDDQTIRRCINYARDWGFGRLEVVNLFALRATDPSVLKEHSAPVGEANDSHLQEVCESTEMVVAAWGANGSLNGRALEVVRMLDTDLHALDTTQDGHPVHPLFQPADLEPQPWAERSLLAETDPDDRDVRTDGGSDEAGRWDRRLEESNLRERAAVMWGTEPQLNKAAEEFSELAAAINRDLNGQQDGDDLLTDIVDARIMLWQLTMWRGDWALEDRLDERLDRLERMLDGEEVDHDVE